MTSVFFVKVGGGGRVKSAGVMEAALVDSVDPEVRLVDHHVVDLDRARYDEATKAIVYDLAPLEPSRGYRDKRFAEYPSPSDLADALYWKAQGDDSRWNEWMTRCAAVKAKYPKESDS